MESIVKHRLDVFIRLTRLDRPVGIWLLLWPVLWALWMAAGGPPPWEILFIFVAGAVVMRSAGCVINDYADRDFDPLVARTAGRPIAAGEVTPSQALLIFAALCLLGLALALMTNPLTLALAVPAVLLAASYPFAKRFHHLPQAHLGLAFAWGIPMAMTAVAHVLGQSVDILLCVLLLAATVSWAMAYDTFYAMADRPEDLHAGVRSSAILFGERDLTIVAALQVLTLLLLAGAGLRAGLGAIYGLGLFAAGLHAARQHWLARDRQPAGCLRAFRENQWFGAMIFVAAALDYGRAAL